MKTSNNFFDRPLYSLTVSEFTELLRSMQRPEPSRKVFGKYLTISDLMEITGYKKQTIYQKTANKEIPGKRKIDGRVLFETAAILEWIESNAIATTSETFNQLMHSQGRAEL
ncbi:MAG: helix-turn-helix domain-containing protein [Synergistaceae bacterium]|jgi:predicted DNA-binding transcriptional regulator AlpA|nr:helix-turn-helix domain-containing protein [Synergistaceae bacterium]HOS46792.1 helix-turn-helix domain-containing protein [Paludibacter sp.]HPM11393.1 helix-turn-helix domain-containing protein [Paludibacter sp.]HRX17394.1 helix-turn-helix domain-containing protein [Spirochaetota bacterium]